MFESQTINAGTIFVGEKGSGRWCEKREAVTVLVRNKTNKTFYKVEDVRSSVAFEIERLDGYDDACLLEDLPTSAGKFGPYKVTLATAAAFCLIEAEGVTLFAHDTQMGLCDEQDFDVEVLLPSGRMYALERSEGAPGARDAPPQGARQDLPRAVPPQHPSGDRRTQCYRTCRGQP